MDAMTSPICAALDRYAVLWDSAALSAVRLQAVLIGERITGRGVVQAVDHAVGVPLWEIEPLLGALVLALLVGAVYPRRRFAPQKPEVCPAPAHAGTGRP